MKKKTDRDVGAAENSAAPVVSTSAAPPPEGSALEPMGVDAIRSRILTVRGVQVMLAPDLAGLYGVPTKVLNQAVKRNIERFPERFMFQLTKDEVSNLRSQTVTSSWGGMRYLPCAFTEHGIIMLSSVLNSPTAVEASVRITDTFVSMRRRSAASEGTFDVCRTRRARKRVLPRDRRRLSGVTR